MSTPRSSRVLVLTAVTAGLGLALTGCSGGGGSGSGDGDTEWTPGALDEFMAQIYGYSYDEEETSNEDLQAESDRQNREVEELVASCMQDEGFDYTPVENNGGTVYSSDDLDVEWGTLEFAEQYGYGISTDPWGMEDQTQPEPETIEDPNQEYRDSMSESEQIAYDEALWGPPQDYVEGEEPTEYDWTTGGCYGAAQHEVYEGGETNTEYADLEDEINTFWETVQNDSRMTELNASWSSCMADAGYDGLTEVTLAQDGLYTEYSELQGWDDPEYAALSESWDWEAKPEGPPAPEIDEAALAAFTKKEIAQAVADTTCQQDLDYTAEQMRIDHELQQDFVDQHRAELQAWADAAGSEK